MRELTTIRNFAQAGKLVICAALAAVAAAVSGAAYEGACAGSRFTVSDGEVWRDNESVGRSGHMGHALVDCGNGRILDFTSNCAGMERVTGHSGYGWMEYRISDDYGKTFGPVRILPCSKKMYEEALAPGHSSTASRWRALVCLRVFSGWIRWLSLSVNR